MRLKLWSAIVVVALLAGCGGDKSPTAPSQPQTAQVAGVWSYTLSLTSVSGTDDCITPALRSGIGQTVSGTLSVTQTGASLSATSRSNSDGSSCTYSGTAGSNSMALSATYCDAAILSGLRCPNGTLRDIQLQSESVNANVSGRSVSGTVGETWNIRFGGTQSAAGTVTLTSSFVGSRQ